MSSGARAHSHNGPPIGLTHPPVIPPSKANGTKSNDEKDEISPSTSYCNSTGTAVHHRTSGSFSDSTEISLVGMSKKREPRAARATKSSRSMDFVEFLNTTPPKNNRPSPIAIPHPTSSNGGNVDNAGADSDGNTARMGSYEAGMYVTLLEAECPGSLAKAGNKTDNKKRVRTCIKGWLGLGKSKDKKGGK